MPGAELAQEVGVEAQWPAEGGDDRSDRRQLLEVTMNPDPQTCEVPGLGGRPDRTAPPAFTGRRVRGEGRLCASTDICLDVAVGAIAVAAGDVALMCVRHLVVARSDEQHLTSMRLRHEHWEAAFRWAWVL